MTDKERIDALEKNMNDLIDSMNLILDTLEMQNKMFKKLTIKEK